MRVRGVRLNVVAVLGSMALLACAACGGTQQEAKGPEKDPWAGYQGTYATSAGASGSPSTRIKSAQASKKEAPPVEVAETTPAAAPPPTPDTTASTTTASPAKKGKAGAKAKKKKAAAPTP